MSSVEHSRKGIRNHRTSIHETASMKYKCTICSKSFYDKQHFTGHVNTHHNVMPYDCSKCKKSFSYKSNLFRHQKTCIEEEKNHKCHICNATFTSAAILKEHTAGMHSETNRYKCGCGQFSKWRSSLGKHRKHCNL